MTPEQRAQEIYDKLANGTEVRYVTLRLDMADHPDLKWAFEELIATAIRDAVAEKEAELQEKNEELEAKVAALRACVHAVAALKDKT
jgi:DNA-binding protein YbaB